MYKLTLSGPTSYQGKRDKLIIRTKRDLITIRDILSGQKGLTNSEQKGPTNFHGKQVNWL